MKKIEELVYQGMVLDEHGGWIPLAEKLRKEKEFLHRLERGEILVNGFWTRMSSLSKATGHQEETSRINVDPSAAVTEETVLAHCATSEETVSFSIETLHDLSADIVPVDPESDYAPETKIFSIARPRRSASSPVRVDTAASSGDQAVVDETQADFSLDKSMISQSGYPRKVPPETEFEETVLYSINMLRHPAKKELSGRAADSAEGTRLSFSGQADDDYDLDGVRPKRKCAVGWVIVIIIAVILLAGSIWVFR
ncbi:MAG: hypothetical protein JW913_02860 [Chitinispirillaceae bacterium]|nr:hypothetical protein [Chitinispirillaceae bacterium]